MHEIAQLTRFSGWIAFLIAGGVYVATQTLQSLMWAGPALLIASVVFNQIDRFFMWLSDKATQREYELQASKERDMKALHRAIADLSNDGDSSIYGRRTLGPSEYEALVDVVNRWFKTCDIRPIDFQNNRHRVAKFCNELNEALAAPSFNSRALTERLRDLREKPQFNTDVQD